MGYVIASEQQKSPEYSLNLPGFLFLTKLKSSSPTSEFRFVCFGCAVAGASYFV
jgi:hypothetical protein